VEEPPLSRDRECGPCRGQVGDLEVSREKGLAAQLAQVSARQIKSGLTCPDAFGEFLFAEQGE
jgi:hypothetical protein